MATWLCAAQTAFPWGPHWQITEAALDRLGRDHPLVRRLGPYAPLLTNYCWMADYKRITFRDIEEEFYADDYLLFPGMTTHLSHLCPEVRETYAPYFRRALQALKTENALNAARWVGSLLHFVQDTGSPPHAAEIGGPAHTKMENWVNAASIRIRGYTPRILGTTADSALAGLEKRMDGLIEFSKLRGNQLRPLVEAGNRAAVEPIALECALETSRVTADLLHTLGAFAQAQEGGVLRGTVAMPAQLGMERHRPKVVLLGTAFSTLADASGHYEFRNLPAGKYNVCAWRGGASATRTVTLKSGTTTTCDLRASSSNLIRNPDFRIKWLGDAAVDCWHKVEQGWEGEIIPLKAGQRYRISVEFQPETLAELAIRWTQQLPHTVPAGTIVPKIEPPALTPANASLVFTATEKMALIQVTLRTKRRPEEVCKRIELVPDSPD